MHTGTGREWNDESVAKLRRLWDEGHSTSEIGRRLSLSKNAIVGKAHRLDLPARASPIRKDGEKRAPATPRRRVIPKLAEIMPLRALPPVIPPGPPVSRTMPETRTPRTPPAVGHDQCRWPIGIPGERGFHFCRDFALVGKPYCEEHCKLAYARPKARDGPVSRRDLETLSGGEWVASCKRRASASPGRMPVSCFESFPPRRVKPAPH